MHLWAKAHPNPLSASRETNERSMQNTIHLSVAHKTLLKHTGNRDDTIMQGMCVVGPLKKSREEKIALFSLVEDFLLRAVTFGTFLCVHRVQRMSLLWM